MADGAQAFKPAQMAQATWDYLLKFTIHHEAIVNHMYHSYPKGSSFPDVSCGVGFLLMPASPKPGDPTKKTPDNTVVTNWVDFFKQADGSAATNDLFIADWETCYGIKRVSHPKNGVIKEFADLCKLVMKEEKIKPKMAQILVQDKLNRELKGSLKDIDYWNLPAVVQVAIASISYGYSPSKMPNFVTALKNKNYEWAASECQLSNMSGIKNRDHRLLFLDAAYIMENAADDAAAFTYLPPKVSDWMTLFSLMGSGQSATP